jgi:nucleotide-binding universal stress UspA family protein
MKTILHPTDFSVNSEQAFRLMCAIARDESAEVIVLHVIPPENCPEEDRDIDELDRDSALYESLCDRFRSLLELADDIPAAFQVKVGPTVETILNVAEQECCDLIVLAGRHHGFMHYQFHGSVSESVLRRAHCPILFLTQSSVQQQPRRILAGLEQPQPDQRRYPRTISRPVFDQEWLDRRGVPREVAGASRHLPNEFR